MTTINELEIVCAAQKISVNIIWLLSFFYLQEKHDLYSSANRKELLATKISKNQRLSKSTDYQVVLTNYLILEVCRFCELYVKYKKYCANLSTLSAEYNHWKAKKVRDYRNKHIGHIQDKETKLPMSTEKAMEHINSIIGSNLDKFLEDVYELALKLDNLAYNVALRAEENH